ncbi:MAG: hypothetical protein R2942_08095 [Ignavibacteria bacterium]
MPQQGPLESRLGAFVGVTVDIDGQVRPGPAGSVNGGATAPDIGYDEFDGVPGGETITPPVIFYTALTNTSSVSSKFYKCNCNRRQRSERNSRNTSESLLQTFI